MNIFLTDISHETREAKAALETKTSGKNVVINSLLLSHFGNFLGFKIAVL